MTHSKIFVSILICMLALSSNFKTNACECEANNLDHAKNTTALNSMIDIKQDQEDEELEEDEQEEDDDQDDDVTETEEQSLTEQEQDEDIQELDQDDTDQDEELEEESTKTDSDAKATESKNSTKEESCTKKAVQTLSITNNIKDADLAYKHWTGSYSPKTFIISVNGKRIKPGATKSIEITNNKLVARYDYDFGYNIKKARGAAEITFSVDNNAKDANLEFCWTNKWRISIDHATPESEETDEFNA